MVLTNILVIYGNPDLENVYLVTFIYIMKDWLAFVQSLSEEGTEQAPLHPHQARARPRDHLADIQSGSKSQRSSARNEQYIIIILIK